MFHNRRGFGSRVFHGQVPARGFFYFGKRVFLAAALLLVALFWGFGSLPAVRAASGQPAPLANPGVDCQPVTFTDDPDPVAETGTITYTVHMKNNSSIAGDNVTGGQLTITVPAGFTYLGHTTDHGTCSYVGDNPSDGTGDYLQCTGIDLGPLEVAIVTMDVQAPVGTGTYTSTATTTCTGDVNSANDSENNQTTVRKGADIQLTKTVNPTSVADSGIVTYTIQLDNGGPRPAPDLEFHDTLPVGVVFYADDADPAADDDSLWTCSASGQAVTCTYDENAGGEFADGDTMIFHFRAKADAGANGYFTNNADVGIIAPPFDPTLDPDPNNNTSQATLEITPGSDLSITKTVTPDPVLGGATATFTLHVENLGPRDVTNVTVTDTLPAGYTVTNITAPAGWNCPTPPITGTVTCTKALMADGEAGDIVLDVDVPNVTSIENHTNTANISPNNPPDPISDNNNASVTYEVKPSAPDLVLQKDKAPNPVAVGGAITNTIHVRNDGPVAASAPIVVEDHLSGLEDFDSAPTGAPWDCSYDAGTHIVTCTLVDAGLNPIGLAAGASAPDLEIHTIAQSNGPITNTATVTDGANADFDTSNNTDQATVNGTNENADIQVSKTVDDTNLDATETTLTFTITITNNGPDPAGDVSFDDEVPFYMPPGAGRPETPITVINDGGGTCSVNNGTVSCEWASLNVHQTVTMQYTVERPMKDGRHINDVCAYSGTVGDLQRGNNCSSAAAVTVQPIADVEVTQKTASFFDDGSGKVLAGTNVVYTIQVRNNGPSKADNVTLQDVFSGEPAPVPAFTFLSASVSGGGSCSFDNSTHTVSCTLGDMEVDEVKTVTVEVRPDHIVPEPSPWHLDNTATVSTTTDESTTTNNSQSLSLPIKGGLVDVSIEKNESPDFVEPIGYDPGGGGNRYIVYQIEVYNYGPSYATNVTVYDRVEMVTPKDGTESLRFVGDTANSDGSGATLDWCSAPSPNPFPVNGSNDDAEPEVQCSFPDLAPSTSATRYLVFEVLEAPHPVQGDVYYNESRVTIAENELDLTNNAEDENTTVRVYSDIAVTKTGPAGPVEIYEHFNLTITVTNYGPGIAPNASLTDTLPAGMVLTGTPTAVSDWGDPVSCNGNAGDTAFTCVLGHVDYDTTHTPQQETITITVPVMVTDPNTTSYDNTACASSDAPEKDPDPHPNCGTTTITMNAPLTLGDLVWYDQNQDGLQDAGEPGLDGVEVILYNTPDCSGSPYQPVPGFTNPVTTGNGSWTDGYYEFYPLPQGDYCLEFNVPTGVLDNPILSPQNVGSDDTVDSDASEPSPGVYRIANINLTADDPTEDVGFYEVGSIGDRVWCESPTNVNDTFDPGDGDTGINGVTVSLYEDFDCDGTADSATPIGGMTTYTNLGADGYYQFTDLQVALAGSSSQTCYVVEVDRTTLPADCSLPDVPDDAQRDQGDTPSLDLDTDSPDTDLADFSFRKADFGDLPDSGSGTFPTTLGDNGPYHLLDEDLYLGDCADAETDGAPDDADAGMVTGGDDGTLSADRVGTCGVGADDEDGIEFVTPFIPGQQACITVTAHNGTGHDINLYGWADWNGDGQFQTGERLSGGDFGSGAASIPNGGVTAQQYCFDVPASATFDNGDIHFRFRLTTESLSAGAFDGPASNGEVEDYWLPLACVGNMLWSDQVPPNNQQDGGEPGIAGIPVRLVWAGPDGTVDTAASDAGAQNDDAIVATTTTDANGRYAFCGVAPPSDGQFTYQVQVPPYIGLKSVNKDAAGDQVDSDADPANTLGTGWVADAFVVAPAFSTGGGPAYLTIDGNPPPTSEGGLEDSNSQGAVTYMDERTDWTQDFGFVEYKDYGDLPESGSGSFATLKGSGGPWHWVTPDLMLGTCVDVETDGAPDDPDAGIFNGGDDGTAGFDALGTCSVGADDEDGVELATPLIPGEQACVTVTATNSTGSTAYLYAWFDWNGNGSFDAGEQVNTGDFSGGSYAFTGSLANQILCFNVPSGATFDGGEVHYRFRLTTDSTLSSPNGGAPDGEVEDYWAPLTCVGSLLWEDRDLAGDQDAGEPGFSGVTVRLVFAGDNDTIDTTPNQSAQNDDRVYTTTTDGTGSYSFCGLTATLLGGGMKYQVQVGPDPHWYATTLDAVADDQDSDAAPAGLSATGWTAPEFTLTLDDGQPGDVAKNFGAVPTSESGVGDATLEANDNNTPDARTDWTMDFGFQQYRDFGDLPESGNGAFPTTQGNNGPSHWVSSDLYLGTCVDAEVDGQPGPRAGAGGSTGDDSNVGFNTVGTCAVAGNDEDGLLSAITPAPPGGTACFQVAAYNNTGTDARLYVWIDWNGDGQFQATEQLSGGDFAAGYATVPNGTVPTSPLTLCFTMPSASALVFDGGEVHSRLRLTTEDLAARPGGYELWEGPAADGEVEDYWAPLACVGNYLWLDTGTTDDVQDSGDSPFANVNVRLVWAGPDGVIDTSPDDATAQNDDVILGTTTTDASGRYMFCGLAPGAASAYVYQVQVPGMPGYYSVTKGVGGNPALDSDATPDDDLFGGWVVDAFGLQVDYTAAPGYILKNGNPLPTGEGGNEDAYSESNDANFPDERTDWTQDLGFVKYDDYGDLPASFEGGTPAVHPLRPDLYLGACVDAESTNAPDAEAGMDGVGGDDSTAGDYTVGVCSPSTDDEDGVTLTTPLIPGAQACVTVTATNGTGGDAYLYAWFDWNGNGTFDAGEQVNTGDFSGGSYAFTGNLNNQQLCFTVPSTATFDGGEVHYRFRLTTDDALAGPTGAAPDGEVEDYWLRLACVGNYVWNDSTGTAQDQQDASDTGLSGVDVTLRWDGNSDGDFADAEDRSYTVTTDTNGRYDFCGLVPGRYQVEVTTPPAGLPEAVYPNQAADDRDSDGVQTTSGGPSVAPVFTITDVTALPTGETGNQDLGAAGGPNNFPDNQVDETIDFGFRPTMLDYGDAPDSYGTSSGTGGPTHVITPDLYLGSCVDAELDAATPLDTTGDDANAGYYTAGTCATPGDDEDGVQLVTPLVPGSQACVKVDAHNATGGDAYLYAWFDWNGNGQFDAGEQVNTVDFSAGYVTIPNGGVSGQQYCFDVPTTATFQGGTVFMRFRLTTDSVLAGPTGPAPDGEVEDYREPLYCVGNFVWNDGGSSTFAVQDGTEPGIAGVEVILRWDGNDNGAFTDGADRTYTTTTDANGFYTFCGLVADATRDGNADAYRIDVTPPTGLTIVPADQGGNEALDSDADPATGQGPVFTLPPSPDSDTASNDTDPNGYPDAQTHLAVDFGFAAYDFGDLPAPYNTTLADGGSRHIILPTNNPTLGTAVDPETDGQPDPAALGDDNADTDDEDGVTLPATFVAGYTYSIGCTVSNATAGTTKLSAWFDWNGDGDFADPGEQVLNNADATTACPFTVTVPLDVAPQVGVRFRIANETIPGPDGALGSGEVEDYLVAGQLTYDYGDLPDGFKTLDASGGPKHQLNAGLYLGACVDGETDAAPDPDAGVLNDGDDATTATVTVGTCASPGDDEDGVQLITPLLPGAEACVQVTAHNATGGNAYLYAWFDWNGDGQFDAGELVNTGDFSAGYVTIPDGGVSGQQYCFTVPSTATFDGGEVHMRFRLTTAALTASDWGGVAPDGEVEDYWTPLACVGNYVWDDTASTAVNAQDASDQPLENITVELTTSGPDGTLGTADDVTVTTTTDAQGRYTFCGLTPGTQGQLRITTLPAGLNQVVVPDFVADDQDSDATQPGGLGSPAEIPVFTVPGLADLAANNWTTGETGNEDASTQTDPALVPGYPDGRTDLSFDFGFRKVNGQATKSLVATDQTFTTGTDVAIGEIVTYETTLTLSPGTVANLTLTDVLDQGLAFVACDSITVTGSVTSSAGAWDAICNNPTVSEYPAGSTDPVDQGRQVTWTFGTVTNSGTDDATITVRYQAVVLDSADNTRGQTLANQATWTWDAGSADASADPVIVVEPTLVVTKEFDPVVAGPNELVTVILRIAHTPESNADTFDVVLTDPLPTGLAFIAGSLTHVSGLAPTTLNYDPVTRTVTATWEDFPLGSTSEIRFQVDLTVLDNVRVTNEATLVWTSLPCDGCDADYALSPHNALARERNYDPPAGGYVSRAQAEIYWVLPETGFAPGRVTPLPEQPAHLQYQATDMWLEIPKLGIKIPVVGVPRNQQGWNLTWLGANAGWLENTTFPTWEGNSAITAHVTLPTGEPGPFAALHTLTWGDQVLIHYQGQVYVYEVRDRALVAPTDTSVVAPTDYPTLTLITCADWSEEQGRFLRRWVVKAVLVEVRSP